MKERTRILGSTEIIRSSDEVEYAGLGWRPNPGQFTGLRAGYMRVRREGDPLVTIFGQVVGGRRA